MQRINIKKFVKKCERYNKIIHHKYDYDIIISFHYCLMNRINLTNYNVFADNVTRIF